jgi:hypothetical protein
MHANRFIRDLKSSRGEVHSFLLNYLTSFYRSALLAHSLLRCFRDQSSSLYPHRETLLPETMRSYVIGITTSMETFFRDQYVYVLSNDETALKRVLPKAQEKTPLVDVHEWLSSGVTFAEIAASKATFQNLAELNRFLSPLFKSSGFLDTLGAYEHKCVVRGFSTRVRLPEGWRSTFAQLFDSRHKFVHDANCVCELTEEAVARIETVSLLIPQFAIELLSNQFESKGTFRSGELPVLVLISDMLGQWEVCDNRAEAGYCFKQ